MIRHCALAAMALALAACGDNHEETSKNTAAPRAGPVTAADGNPPFGLFDVTAPDGNVYREEIREDGSFSSTAEDGSIVEGIWEQRDDGIFCSKPLGAPVWRCKKETVNQSGTWTSTELDGGAVSLVKRIEP